MKKSLVLVNSQKQHLIIGMSIWLKVHTQSWMVFFLLFNILTSYTCHQCTCPKSLCGEISCLNRLCPKYMYKGGWSICFGRTGILSKVDGESQPLLQQQQQQQQVVPLQDIYMQSRSEALQNVEYTIHELSNICLPAGRLSSGFYLSHLCIVHYCFIPKIRFMIYVTITYKLTWFLSNFVSKLILIFRVETGISL